MQYEKFTTMSREALTSALRLAKEQGNPEIRPGHILLGLLSQDKGIVGNLIRQIGADEGQVQRELQSILQRYPSASGGSSPRQSREMEQVITAAHTVAREFGDSHVTNEVLFLAISKVRSYTQQMRWKWSEKVEKPKVKTRRATTSP